MRLEHRISTKDIVSLPSVPGVLPQFILPRLTLRSWGFDPDGEFVWWDDPVKDERVICQEVPGSD